MDRYLIEWAEDYGTADLRLALIAGLATAEMVRAEMAIEAAAAAARRSSVAEPKRPVTNMAAWKCPTCGKWVKGEAITIRCAFAARKG